jgi:hypothetical protein
MKIKLKISYSFNSTQLDNNKVTAREIYAKLGKIVTLGWQQCKNFSTVSFFQFLAIFVFRYSGSKRPLKVIFSDF